MARDVFRDCLLRVADAGYEIILQVHDELVVEADEDKAEEVAADLKRIIGVPPTWAPSLPVATDAVIGKSYDLCK